MDSHRTAMTSLVLGWKQFVHRWNQLAHKMHLRSEGLFWVIFTVICWIAIAVVFVALYRKLREEEREKQMMGATTTETTTATDLKNQQDRGDVHSVRKERLL